uniref:Uncharacterized protein n=1 Tax=Lactuca sativa TaxID=4236 RepID=A0A9R1W368_LACSA|nr:hypothetical protein LSAT_V11C300152840 [Lactuca sativa]
MVKENKINQYPNNLGYQFHITPPPIITTPNPIPIRHRFQQLAHKQTQGVVAAEFFERAATRIAFSDKKKPLCHRKFISVFTIRSLWPDGESSERSSRTAVDKKLARFEKANIDVEKEENM